MAKGFSVKTTVETIVVPLEVNTFDEDTGEHGIVRVEHVFKFPSPTVREQYQQRVVTVKGKKVKHHGTAEANWWLWLQCILTVKNYEDLELDKEGKWKEVFAGQILRIHAEKAAEMLLNEIDADEGEAEKKLERSSAQ